VAVTVTAFGLVQLERPMRHPWPATGLPRVVFLLDGRRFVRSSGIGKPGVVAHYREDIGTRSARAYVMSDGTYMIDHLDDSNPGHRDGSLLAHFLKDVL